MKFGKEYTAQMVPEWQQAYMDYNKLKAVLKEIQRFKQMRAPPSPSPAAGESSGGLKRKMTMYRAFSGLTRRYSRGGSGGGGAAAAAEEQVILVNPVDREGAGSGKYETMFLMSSEEGGEYETVFFRRLDDEFNKVNSFYGKKVKEVLAEADDLTKQMNALIAFRLRVENPNSYHNFVASSATPSPTSPNTEDLLPTQTRLGKPAHMDAIQEVEMSGEGLREISEESIVDVDEPENNTSVHETKSEPDNKRSVHGTKAKKKSSRLAPIEVLQHVKINVALETPRSTIKSMLTDAKYKDMRFSKEELRKVEEQLKQAFIEFYQKLRLLKSYSFLNLLAFSKIMKKYDKITSRSASRSYLNMVDNSYLGSSDEVTRLMERVEVTFIKHFANANRTKGMNTLRPKAKREKHRTTFFFGFAVGCSIALLVALILIVRTRNIYNMPGSTRYMSTMFPLYSFFGFIVLHMLMYAADIYFWRRYRVNYPFIFGFKRCTELGYRRVSLLGSSLAVLALAGVLANLDMEMDPNTKRYEALTELVPLGLVALVVLITFCPFNIIYRSSRFFLLRCAFHCICAPLYKVTLPDFFLADQLTSQVQAIRNIEFYICYYGWGNFTRREQSCNQNAVYNTFFFIIAVIPYWSRFLQCMRRLVEEKDKWQGYNALKYFSTIVAVVTRTAYGYNKAWLIPAVISSVIATVVSTYWDIVIDWGLLQKNSKNRWLRDKLLVSHRSAYFAAMVLNVLLRFAWLQSVIGFTLPNMHIGAMATTFACLEIIRRGIWNFFRIENEHLNNVGKYRAFKSVPLPFNYDTEGDDDE